MKRALILLAAGAAFASPAPAAVIELTVDVPTTLAGSTFVPEQIVRNQDVSYSSLAALPTGTGISALARTPEGPWLLTPSHTSMLGGMEIEPRDLVLFDGASFTLALDGSAAGIPAGARIDAVAYDPASGSILMSFDEPVALGGVDYLASDLVALGAGFSLYWSATAAGVPAGANVTGADIDSAGNLVVTFDAPVDLALTTYLPGQLVRWDGGTSFSLYLGLAAWPISSQVSDFSFLPAAGAVPDGTGTTTPLTVAEAGGGFLSLSWGGSCSSLDNDYEVYEGDIVPPFTTHHPILCSTGGQTTQTFLPSPGDRYYLIVPRNAVTEGSYGQDSNGLERSAGSTVCVPREIAAVCQ